MIAGLERERRLSLFACAAGSTSVGGVITRILSKLYGDAQERIEAVVSVARDAFELDDYWLVLKQIDGATRGDVGRLAGVLDELGPVDVALVAHHTHTKRRLAFLDEFDALIGNPATLEKEVHGAVEHNLCCSVPGTA